MTGFDPGALHWLRPDWLWALVAVPLLAVFGWWRRRHQEVWARVVDPHLLVHLVERRASRALWWGGLALLLGYVVAVVALAGPSWRQVDSPLWRGKVPLVVVVELSDAMLAADPPPSRLAQARAKLERLLDARPDVPVGLVVFAEQAFTVAPVTDDAANVALFLDALAPDVMPRDGADPAEGIRHAVRLMQQAGYERGRVLLMAGQADGQAIEAATEAAAAGFEVRVLGVGNSGRMPYRTPDGDQGEAGFDEATLRSVAVAGAGRYARIAGDDSDVSSLGLLTATLDEADPAAPGAEGETGRQWQDEGFWLLPPLMLLALFAFRRNAGMAALVLLPLLILPAPPAQAMELWRRADQVEHRRMATATDAYRKGDYAEAAHAFGELDSADAHYNRGNALAKAGHYPQAIEAYDRALALQPGMEDAIANREAVRAAMQRPPRDGDGGEQGDTADTGQPPSQPSPGDGPADAAKGDEPAGTAGRPPTPSESSDPAEAPRHGDGAEASGPSDPPPSGPPDPGAQAEADRALRERMRDALEAGAEGADAGDPAVGADGPPADETPQERERRIANEAWLRRVPDDPGGLLRDKFRIEYERRRRAGELED